MTWNKCRQIYLYIAFHEFVNICVRDIFMFVYFLWYFYVCKYIWFLYGICLEKDIFVLKKIFFIFSRQKGFPWKRYFYVFKTKRFALKKVSLSFQGKWVCLEKDICTFSRRLGLPWKNKTLLYLRGKKVCLEKIRHCYICEAKRCALKK